MKKYSKEIHEKALNLYLEGNSLRSIGKKIGITRQTLSTWAKKENWVKSNKRVGEKALEKIEDTSAEMRKRQIKICQAAEQKWLRQVLENMNQKITLSEVIGAMKHELLLAGEITNRNELKITLKDLFKDVDMGK